MKKLIILFFVLITKLSFAQVASYCGPFTSHAAITMSGASNQTISGDSINLSNANTVGINLTNCSNIHITKCKIVNSKNFAIHLNNCTNITVDSTVIDNVGFGVYAENGSSVIKVNANWITNVNGINSSLLGHAVQFNQVNGGGSQINYNIIENPLARSDTSRHPHDQINVFESNGLLGDSIQVIGNEIRYGQINAWPSSSFTGAGIIMGDVSGSYQACRYNKMVTTGCAGIQCNGNSTSIKIDHNDIYGDYTPVSGNGIIILNNNTIQCDHNRVNWTNKNHLNVLLSDGETQYYLGSPASPTPTGFSTNTWQASITSSILPSSLFSGCSAPISVVPPHISYSSSSYTFTAGTAITSLTPTNTGDPVTSWSISTSLPAGLSFNTSTGVISGTPTAAHTSSSYTVTATNAGGSGTFTFSIQVNNSGSLIIIKRKIHLL